MKHSERMIRPITKMIICLVFLVLAGAIASYPYLRQRWLDTCLWGAARRNAFGRVRQLVHQGANINERDEDENPLLSEAISWGSLETVRVLLRSKPDVNAVNPRAGVTSLMLASSVGADDIVVELLNQGANVNVQSYYGDTALIAAASQKHATIVAYLLEHGANRNLCDMHGQTALIKVQKQINDTRDIKRKMKYEAVLKLLQ